MTDSNKLNRWQIRDLRVLKTILGVNKSFEKRAQELRQNWNSKPSPDIIPSLFQLMQDYEIPPRCSECIKQYILTKEINPTLIQPSIIILSEKDNTVEPSDIPPGFQKFIYDQSRKQLGIPEVRLILSHDTTRQELDDFINKYWTSYIQPRLNNIYGYKRKNIRESPKAERDADILYMSNEGMNSSNIAKKINKKYYSNNKDINNIFTVEDVRRILHRNKKYRKKK